MPLLCVSVSRPHEAAVIERVWCRPRLLATCGCWFLWDFSFYGNKVFQSAFIKILSPAGAGQFISLSLIWPHSLTHKMEYAFIGPCCMLLQLRMRVLPMCPNLHLMSTSHLSILSLD